MPEGKVIAVSFGKPTNDSSDVEYGGRGEGSITSITEISQYRDANARDFVARLRVVAVFVEKVLASIGLAISVEDRKWLQDNPKLADEIIGRIRAIKSGDGKVWKVDHSRKAIVRFPPNFPERIRLFIFIEEQGGKCEYLGENAASVSFVF